MGSISPSQLSDCYQDCGDAMVLYARQWLDPEGARDVVQDVFLRLLGQRDVRDVKAWLFRSVRNAAINQLRSRRRRGRHEEAIAGQSCQWFEEQPGDLLDAQAAQRSLELLETQQREIVVLRLWAAMTFQQIADLVGLSLSTVYGKYEAAIKDLQKAMGVSCSTRKK